MQADSSPRVAATESAVAEIERLRAEHGPPMYFQSGGCDGSSPMYVPDGELLLGPNEPLYVLPRMFGAFHLWGKTPANAIVVNESDDGCALFRKATSAVGSVTTVRIEDDVVCAEGGGPA
jgi:hypothetical protein